MNHPDNAAIDIPAQDGTLLRITLHRESDTGRFTYSSLVDVQRHTPHGLRPVASYRMGPMVRAPRNRGFGLHAEDPGLTIEGHWMIVIGDWMEMLSEASVDTWKVDV